MGTPLPTERSWPSASTPRERRYDKRLRRWNWTAGWNAFRARHLRRRTQTGSGPPAHVLHPRPAIAGVDAVHKDSQHQPRAGRRRGCAATQPATWNPGAPRRAGQGVSGEPLAHDVAYLAGSLPRLRQELERRGSLSNAARGVRRTAGARGGPGRDGPGGSRRSRTTVRGRWTAHAVDPSHSLGCRGPTGRVHPHFRGTASSFISHSTVDDGMEPAQSRQE